MAYLANTSHGNLRIQKRIRSRGQLLDLLGREPMRPFLRVVAIILGLPDRGASDLLGEFIEGMDMFVEGRVLTSGFQTVGEDVQGDTGGLLLSKSHGDEVNR